jgi:hypothetical protein
MRMSPAHAERRPLSSRNPAIPEAVLRCGRASCGSGGGSSLRSHGGRTPRPHGELTISVRCTSAVVSPYHPSACVRAHPPHIQPSYAVSHPADARHRALAAHGEGSFSSERSSKFGISERRGPPPHLRPLQPGAPHSSSGMYLEMMRQASLLKPAYCTSGRERPVTLRTARSPHLHLGATPRDRGR